MSRRGVFPSALQYGEWRSRVFFASNSKVRKAMVTWCKRLFASGILLVMSVTAVSQGIDSSDLITERPDPPGTATVVDIAIYLLDIDEVDDVSQKFSVDMFLRSRWQDSRLAVAADQRTGKLRQLSLEEIWTPHAVVVNDRGLELQLPRVGTVDDVGNVTYRQRMSGELAATLKLREFPFDTQRLEIDIVSYLYAPTEVRFASTIQIIDDSEAFSAIGWQFKILDAEIGEFEIPSEQIIRSRTTYVIEAERDAQYYLLTMLLPMTLIVFMAWTVFWLQPDIVPPRIGISTAAIFSLIAFGFSMRLSLPPVSYMTRADIFVIGCTLLVFVALGVAVIGSRLAKSERMETALRINAISRWLYATLFFVVVVMALRV